MLLETSGLVDGLPYAFFGHSLGALVAYETARPLLFFFLFLIFFRVEGLGLRGPRVGGGSEKVLQQF